MTIARDGGLLRRYIIGTASDEECEAVEHEYFESADALDRVRAAEDEVIDEYVSGELAPDEHADFERHYLISPPHRRRVAVARGLRTAASARSRRSLAGWRWQAGLAAALIVVILGAALLLRTRFAPGSMAVDSPPAATAPPPPPPPPALTPAPGRPDTVVVALSISPILVRGSDQPASLTITMRTDIVRLDLQGQGTEDRLGPSRAVVRTVTGREVWTGPAHAFPGATRRELASVDVPADRLPPDDYIVVLLERDGRGRDVERHRYFFRVRRR